MAKEEIRARRRSVKIDKHARRQELRKVLLDGAAWEEATAALIAKVSPKKFKQKRLGAKAAKAAERFESQGDIF